MRATPLLLAAAAALTFASAAQAAPRGPNLGTMAGYVSDGAPVDSLSATFAVPRMRAGSPAGAFAATWIGAQAPGVNGPFIQIGVNEIHAFLLAAPTTALRARADPSRPGRTPQSWPPHRGRPRRI